MLTHPVTIAIIVVFLVIPVGGALLVQWLRARAHRAKQDAVWVPLAESRGGGVTRGRRFHHHMIGVPCAAGGTLTIGVSDSLAVDKDVVHTDSSHVGSWHTQLHGDYLERNSCAFVATSQEGPTLIRAPKGAQIPPELWTPRAASLMASLGKHAKLASGGSVIAIRWKGVVVDRAVLENAIALVDELIINAHARAVAPSIASAA